ncbi:MAG: NAD(+)--dinitrogen-reductase ADP-D-ribosyltransferase [Candidatus Accumulibacter sp.]|uniref:NAD(+)--dinitrogen-reductase ADP-D-ribosyltransferase n=2 Tax=Candidatus Accumulibacter TaxID=327159 RepID=C7RRG3_ACCRE|nr:NAD(+)--dinitrogen-reductase ADP-D-ribosyltransferase [Accumulibacter sp.]
MSDIPASVCRAPDKEGEIFSTLPRLARLPINRCNLPADILGGLTYQRHPTPLQIDGVADLHKPLWALLDDIPGAGERAERFAGYMENHFRLRQPEDAGLVTGQSGARAKASYLRVVRGWAFDSESREAAVLKGWVESRFGLSPRHHGEPLREPGSAAWQRYVEIRAQGLRGTNALESQLDLLYAYTQYELARQFPQRTHLRLYRGVNRLAEHETVQDNRQGEKVLLLNNINSFSRSRERAGEFGDDLLAVDVPLPKLAFFSRLLPGMLRGEDEYVVIGGLYRVRLARF